MCTEWNLNHFQFLYLFHNQITAKVLHKGYLYTITLVIFLSPFYDTSTLNFAACEITLSRKPYNYASWHAIRSSYQNVKAVQNPLVSAVIMTTYCWCCRSLRDTSILTCWMAFNIQEPYNTPSSLLPPPPLPTSPRYLRPILPIMQFVKWAIWKWLKGLCHGSPVHFVKFCQLLALNRYGT